MKTIKIIAVAMLDVALIISGIVALMLLFGEVDENTTLTIAEVGLIKALSFLAIWGVYKIAYLINPWLRKAISDAKKETI